MKKYLYNLATDKERGFLSALLKPLLFVLSLIYGLIVRVLIFINTGNQYRLKAKVISIGNITLGGTGKTSLVEYIARYLSGSRHKLAILSRGYKRRSCGCAGQALAHDVMGDETHMLQKNLGVPVIVDSDRVRGGNLAIKEGHPDTLILDDGFQQWRIKKDLEIVTIDAANPFGNGCLLPRGILREPLFSLGRADIFMLAKTNLTPDTQKIKHKLKELNPRALIADSVHAPAGFYELGGPGKLLSTEELKGKTVILISGIGDPASFEQLISGLGVKIGISLRFEDHYNYSREDLEKAALAAKEKNIDIFVTTEKDAARLTPEVAVLRGLKVLVLRIELKIIANEKEFHNRLLKLYSL